MAIEESNQAQYSFTEIEAKWQKYWLEHRTFKTPEADRSKPKYYILDMFPYPSGDGLHVGHPEGYTATDILARYKRMRGFNVLHPMGWDAFGLPAEQHAIKTGQHPRATTRKNIDRFREQIRSIGLSYDWDREVDTTDPKYFRWTQWIFLKLFERGLAYEDFRAVNWCPALGTVLANEEVVDGKSEVGGHPVVQKPMRQWVLKITAYAERLLADLDGLDWPESVKDMQRNWIGRSEGAFIDFAVDGSAQRFTVFTTRPDTLFGASFCVLAPEHPLVETITQAARKAEVDAYRSAAEKLSEMDRSAQLREKTGVFTGAHALHPVTGAKLPIYVADYVLAHYGTAALMAVPAHDERDHAFAKKYHLPIKRVISGGSEDIEAEAHCGEGTMLASDFLDGLASKDAIEAMIRWLEDKKCGRKTVSYKLRDWIFSRQRYWGEPIPLIRDVETGEIKAVPMEELPIGLPELEDYRPSPSGEPPLDKAKLWVEFKGKDGRTYRRETNTMPQWAGSCWYYLRYIDPHNDREAWSKEKENYWMPVDLYVGGVEHAVMHLLYARFWHKVLYDCGLVSTKEPFQSLMNQGMILGENHEKMSKSRGNVVNPDDVIAEWGADSLRLYEMFMGPLEAAKPWQTKGIVGCHRFLSRVVRFFLNPDGSLQPKALAEDEPREVTRQLHRTIKKVGADIEAMQFNTAISAMMEFVNLIYREGRLTRASSETFILILAPFAPHLAEELWQKFGHASTLAYEAWPQFDESYARDERQTIAVSVNGKTRAMLDIEIGTEAAAVLQRARAHETIAKFLEGKELVKEIFVPGKIINFVVK